MQSNQLIKRILDIKNAMLNYDSKKAFSRLMENYETDHKVPTITAKNDSNELLIDYTKRLIGNKGNQVRKQKD
jgi:hypothetical protein